MCMAIGHSQQKMLRKKNTNGNMEKTLKLYCPGNIVFKKLSEAYGLKSTSSEAHSLNTLKLTP